MFMPHTCLYLLMNAWLCCAICIYIYVCVCFLALLLSHGLFVLTAHWQRQYDGFSLMVTLYAKPCPNYSHKKCGAESPLTQERQTVERRVNNSSLAATIIHHHPSSISQSQTTRPLRPDPLIPFASIVLSSLISSDHMPSESFIYFLYWLVPSVPQPCPACQFTCPSQTDTHIHIHDS